jgi:excinuclease ABC subunit A
VFEELRAQGFVRARIDGEGGRRPRRPPELDKNRKHTSRPSSTASRSARTRAAPGRVLRDRAGTSDGVAAGRWMDMDGEAADHGLFSARFACPVCGYSINELEPRLFSFNNPAGACPACDGLGVKQFFDPERVVVHPLSSLAEGAIRGWDRRNAYYFQLLSSLAEHYGFDIDTPFESLPKSIQKIILHGSGKEKIAFSLRQRPRHVFKRKHPSRAFIPNMERRYRETESHRCARSVRYPVHRSPAPPAAAAGSTRGAPRVRRRAHLPSDHALCPWARPRRYFEPRSDGAAGRASPTRSSRRSAPAELPGGRRPRTT